MTDGLQRVHDSDVPHDVEANLQAFIQTYVDISGGETDARDDLTRVYSGMLMPYFNGVVRTNLPLDLLDDAIESTLAYFYKRAQDFVWWVGPSSTPDAELRAALTSHGLTWTSQERGMAMDITQAAFDAPMPEGATITSVSSADDWRDWLAVYGIGYELKPEVTTDYGARMWKLLDHPEKIGPYYLARLNDRPAAISCLCCGAGVAGIYEVATHPEFRNMGLGTALTLAALREAQTRGYGLAVLQATPEGVNMYQRIGFRVCCVFDAYYS